MTESEKLYETLGELIYVVAKADGVISESEKSALKEMLKGHSFATEINWSFNYETSKEKSVNEVYDKVLAVCHRIGPSPVYEEFIEAMNTIAKADNKVDQEEAVILNSFSKDLIERFTKDIEKFYD